MVEAAPSGARWFICRVRRPRAAVRLYCFPHSGGSPGEFVRWADRLHGVEVCGLQLPGRGARFGEAPVTRLAAVVEAVVESGQLQPPFAFFGHSLGAIVAYEVARGLRAAGREQPEHLFVSACPAPHLERRLPPVHRLPDGELLASIQDLYGPISEDPDVLRIVAGHHRADAEMLETYAHRAGEALAVPITAIGGTEDRVAEPELAAWRHHTVGPFQVRLLPGSHFYFRERLDDLLRLIVETLASPSELLQ